MGKIFIQGTPVNLGTTIASHLNIIYEDDSGLFHILGAAPQIGFTQALENKVTTGVFSQGFITYDTSVGADDGVAGFSAQFLSENPLLWRNGSLVNARELNLGSRNAADVWEVMKREASNINNKFPYIFASQNSNSAANTLLATVGLDIDSNSPPQSFGVGYFGSSNWLDLDYRLDGTIGDDIIVAQSGSVFSSTSQQISGHAGNDEIRGGDGNDILDGGPDNDKVFGEEGEDTIIGGQGNDQIDGGHSNLIYGPVAVDQQQDVLKYDALGAEVTFTLQGENSNPLRVGNVAVSKDKGALGTDSVTEVEKFIGTDFADALVLDGSTSFSAFSNSALGFSRPSVIFDLGGHSKSGNVGDTIDAARFAQALKIDLSKYSAQTIQLRTGGDSISVKGADAVLGTAADDEIIGNNNGNALVGGGGADIIKGGSGNDRLVGGNKDGDTYSDDGAVDTITSGGGADWIYFSNQDHVTDRTGASRLFFANGTPRPTAAFARAILPVGGSEGSAHLILGGEAKLAPRNPCAPGGDPTSVGNDGVYKGTDGTLYRLTSGALEIEYDGGKAYLDTFRNGDGGVRLKDTRPNMDQAECNKDPLIIDLDGDQNVVRELFDSTAYFDLDNDGFKERVAWTLGGDGFLVRDLNGNGQIDNGTELFGTGRSETEAADYAQKGTNGFAELATLDSNHDGLISALDADFATLKVWVDANGDAVTDDGELKTLADLGIVSISIKTIQSNPSYSPGWALMVGGSGISL